ncbi:MAG: hypothetical protein PW792_05280 [Acidobacteriaceae bacterium]|nr:hypothetical protein [Acidobacteriaceae bacterium]
MRPIASADRRTNRRLFSGALLCLLVVAFALIAKTSWYKPHPQRQHPIASMKAARAEFATLDFALPAIDLTTAFATAFAAFVAAVAVLVVSEPRPVVAVAREGYRKRQLARPPPASSRL